MLVINPMVIIIPRADSIEIIALKPVKKMAGINLMSLSASWDDSLDIIYFQPVKKTTMS